MKAVYNSDTKTAEVTVDKGTFTFPALDLTYPTQIAIDDWEWIAFVNGKAYLVWEEAMDVCDIEYGMDTL